MGVMKHLGSVWKQPKQNIPAAARRDRMAGWRREPVFQRIERPTRLDAARRVGYRAKQGITVCLLYTSPSPRDKRQSRMPSSA